MNRAFLINPGARGGRTRRRLDHLQSRIFHVFPDAEIRVPSTPGEFEESVTSLSRTVDHLAVLGGDGTFSHALNGLMRGDPRRCALACLHHGSGADFLHTSGFPRHLGPALERLKTARPRPCDGGRITTSAGTRYFINEASIGLGGEVDAFLKRHRVPLPATLMYFIAALLTTLRYRPPELRITVDGRTVEHRFLVVAAANGRYFGGRMFISPESDLHDGVLNLVGLPPWGYPKLLYLAYMIYRGTQLKHPQTLHLPFRTARIEAPHETTVAIDVDGEVFGTLPAEIEVVPNAFQLLS